VISQLITDELTDRGYRETEIDALRERFARVFLLALEEDTRPPSLTVDYAMDASSSGAGLRCSRPHLSIASITG
jgi:hypothetical protein